MPYCVYFYTDIVRQTPFKYKYFEFDVQNAHDSV